MSAFPNGFIPQLDRYDVRSVVRLFHSLWPDESVLIACATGFADSIHTAHGVAEGCWSVTMFEDMVRLNVGQVEVLTLFGNAIRLLVRAPFKHTERPGFVLRVEDTPIYPAVPIPSGICLVPPAELASLPAELREAHTDYINAAASYKKVSPFKKSFSPAVLECIESLLKVSLPRPNYTAPELSARVQPLADELNESTPICEGAKFRVAVNVYERDPRARAICVANHGCACAICGFVFEQQYGEIAKGFIHVHHLQPLSEIGEEHEVDPIADFRPVCPNCHAVLHLRVPAYSIEEDMSFRKRPHGPEPAE